MHGFSITSTFPFPMSCSMELLLWSLSSCSPYGSKQWTIKIWAFQDFPGGTVLKNPPANAGDMGSIPGLRRSHMPQSNLACVPQLLSLRATTTEAHVLRAVLCNKRSHRNEKPAHHNEE